MTASAVRYSSSCLEPTVSRQPAAVRASPRTMAPVRTAAPEAAATAAGSVPSPPASVVNTGDGMPRIQAPAGRIRQQRSRRLGQGGVLARLCCQRGQGGLEGQFLRPAGVDPGEKRIHQAVHHLLAEPGRHERGHRHVAVPVGGRKAEVLPCPGHAVAGHQPGAGQLGQVGGHAQHLTAGQRAHLAPAPDPRRRGARPDQLAAEASRGGQPGALGAAGEQRLRALIHRDPGDLADAELAAEPRRAFQHGDPARGLAEEERRGQPGDAPADDHDMRLPGIAHRSTLAETRAAGRPGPADPADGGASAPPATAIPAPL